MAREILRNAGNWRRRRGHIEPLEERRLLAADHLQLVKDILEFTESSEVGKLTVAGELLYFTVDDQSTGPELWVTNGTTGGTHLVRDINPGPAGILLDHLTAVGDTLYFTADDGVSGNQLWRTDGSEAGTIRLSSVPGAGLEIPDITAFDGAIYFIVYAAADESLAIWRSDGTVAGTHPLIVGDAAPIEPRELTASGNSLYFAAGNSDYDLELWRSDGTSEGTAEFKNINPTDISNPTGFVDVDGKLYFSANDGSGQILWVSDGTPDGTVAVKGIHAPNGLSQPVVLGAIDGDVLVAADDGTLHQVLWRIDPAGNIGHIGSPGLEWLTVKPAAALSNAILFVGHDASGAELWRSDGTEAGTYRTRDINLGAGSSQPSEFAVFDNTLYFAATDSAGVSRLWRSDGTSFGTVRMSGIALAPRDLEVFAGRLFFAAIDSAGRELWTSNGSIEGTSRFIDIATQSSTTARPLGLTRWGNSVFFFNETSLWKSDGTAEGTVFITDIDGKDGVHWFGISDITVANDRVFFTAMNANSVEHPWTSDGTAEGTRLLKSMGQNLGSVGGFAAAGEFVYFSRSSYDGTKLWRTDGTTAGTIALGSLNHSGIFEISGKIIFAGGNPGLGLELWTTDGTVGGTRVLRDFRLATKGGIVSGLVEHNGLAYFLVLDGVNPMTLWQSDGTEAGTAPVVQVASVINQTSTIDVAGDSLYLVVAGTTWGDYRVWKSDGTAVGTIPLVEFHPPQSNRMPDNFTAAGELAYFTVDDGVSGIELWRTDGTPNGTMLVRDITAGSGSTTIREMTAVGETLYFVVGDYSYFTGDGPVLWRSDGTAAGTAPVTIFLPEAAHLSNYSDLEAVGNILYFVAYDSYLGAAPWILDTRTPGDANNDGFVDGADYTDWADSFLTSPTTSITFNAGDFNRDGFVDGADYILWADNLQLSPPATPALVTADGKSQPTSALSAAVDEVLTSPRLASPSPADYFDENWIRWLAIAKSMQEDAEFQIVRRTSNR